MQRNTLIVGNVLYLQNEWLQRDGRLTSVFTRVEFCVTGQVSKSLGRSVEELEPFPKLKLMEFILGQIWIVTIKKKSVSEKVL